MALTGEKYSGDNLVMDWNGARLDQTLLREIVISPKREMYDKSGSGERARRRHGGKREYTIRITLLGTTRDADLQTRFDETSSAPAAFVIYPNGDTGGEPTRTGNAWVESVEESIPTEGMIGLVISCAIDGDLVDGVGFTYLFRALFGTDTPAPLANPFAVEVGSIVPVDTANKLSVLADALNLLGKSTWGDPAFRSSGTIARAAGNALIFECVPPASAVTSYYILGGHHTTTISTTPRTGFALKSGLTLAAVNGGGEADIMQVMPEVANKLAVVMRATGGFLVNIDFGLLTYVGNLGNEALYLGGTGYHAQTLKVNEMHAAAWGDDWESDAGLLTQNVASPVSGQTLTYDGEMAFIEITWVPGAGETLSFEFHKTDADNLWRVDCAQAGGTIKLWKREAGVETEYETGKTQSWTVGGSFRVGIWLCRTTIATSVNDYSKNVYHGANLNQGIDGGRVTGFTSASNLKTWAVNVNNLIPDYIRQSVPACYMMLGDSKASESGIPATFGALSGLRSARAITAGGGTVVTRAASIVADLASKPGQYDVRYVLCMLGINDVSAATVEATFKSSYLTILDAIHAKWPLAEVYLEKLWKPSGTAACAPYNTYIDYVISQRSFAREGANEYVLENGDNGATYYADSVHPNAAGYAILSQQFINKIGL